MSDNPSDRDPNGPAAPSGKDAEYRRALIDAEVLDISIRKAIRATAPRRSWWEQIVDNATFGVVLLFFGMLVAGSEADKKQTEARHREVVSSLRNQLTHLDEAVDENKQARDADAARSEEHRREMLVELEKNRVLTVEVKVLTEENARLTKEVKEKVEGWR